VTGGITALVFSDRDEIRETEEAITSLGERIRAADFEIHKTKDREDQVIVFREVQSRELEILPQKQQIADFHMNLTTFLTQAGASFSKIPENAPKESELARGVYVTPNTVEFTADSASLLRFVNMIENDPRLVAVKGLKIKAGSRKLGDPDGPVAHEVELHLESYSYSPATAKTEFVPIPNYEARLEDPALRAAGGGGWLIRTQRASSSSTARRFGLKPGRRLPAPCTRPASTSSPAVSSITARGASSVAAGAARIAFAP
jgi:hypothetical protein